MPVPTYTLKYTPAYIVSRLFIAKGLGTELTAGQSWPIAIGAEPASPDNTITLYSTVGVVDARSHIDGRMFEKFGLQVRIRASNEKLGWQRANKVITSMSQDVRNVEVEVEGTHYLIGCFSRISPIDNQGKADPNSSRNLLFINALVTIKQLT